MSTDVHPGELQARKREKRLQMVRDIISNSALQEEKDDPLGANMFFSKLCALRADGQHEVIRANASALVARLGVLRDLPRCNLKTLHRDIAMAITAATLPAEAGQVPAVDDVIPGGGEALLRLAAWTGFPPRCTDSVYTGIHSRRFTRTRTSVWTTSEGERHACTVYAEDIFKVCVGEAMAHQSALVTCMTALTYHHVTEPEFTQLMQEAARHFSSLVAAISVVREFLPTDYFCRELLPFFMPYKVAGQEYIHSGSQMIGPLVCDTVLGIATYDDMAASRAGEAPGFQDEYAAYQQKNLYYALEQHRADLAIIRRNLRTGSVVDSLLALIPEHVSGSPRERQALPPGSGTDLPMEVRGAIQATYDLLKEVYMFRKPHLTTIKESLKYRTDHGSSGGATHIPYVLLTRTKDRLDQLRPFVDEHRAPHP
jgi:hypothetical protein